MRLAESKQAFYEDKLTVAHTFQIARLQRNNQRRALQECFPQYRNAAAILKDKRAEATTVRELRAWIEREIHLDLTRRRLTRKTKRFCPKAGACARCPKRTGSNPLLFPEVRQKFICTDRKSYRAKVEALDYFRRLGHDNHRRLPKLCAWEEKKSKASWGARIVDYEKIAAAALQTMKAADLNRSLVVCALVLNAASLDTTPDSACHL